MKDFCFPVVNSTKKGKQFSDFALLCSFIFSYLVFFSPYLLKLLAFLSPLFITTALLLLALFTSILHDAANISSLLENVQRRFDENGDDEEDGESRQVQMFEEFEAYKIVFGSPAFDLAGYPDGETALDGAFSGHGSLSESLKENPVEFSRKFEGESCRTRVADGVGENPGLEIEEKVLGVVISDDFPEKIVRENPDEFSGKRQDVERLEQLSTTQETAKCGKLTCGVWEENQIVSNQKSLEKTPSSVNGGNHTQQKPLMKTHSRRYGQAVWKSYDGHNSSKKHDDYSYSPSEPKSESQPISPSLSSHGSMRKEKEWRKTLACKLFEERHNVGGGGGVCGGDGGEEGMDLLWETYEKREKSKGKQSSSLKKKEKEKEKNKKKGRVVDYTKDYSDEEEEEEEGDDGHLCCLQALKFSAGKMHFGMGKPGFLKISKAFKGIGAGWLKNNHHQHGGSKKGKKF